MGQPTITIFNHTRAPTGHWWVDVDDGEGNVTRGSFGPKKITGPGTAFGALGFPVGGADGQFRSGDSKTFNDDKMKNPHAQVTIPITREGYDHAIGQISKWQAANPGLDYRATGIHPNNCIDAAQDIANAAGVPGQIADYFPTDVLRDSPAGVQAMRRAGARDDDPGSTPIDFPDMAFPWSYGEADPRSPLRRCASRSSVGTR